MSLSNELISQFVKATNDSKKTKTEATVYGTIVEYEGSKYVRIDGSELLTPITTTADTVDGERVTVMIKNHTATVTGNISSPAARVDDIEDVSDIVDKIAEFEIVIADKVSTKEFDTVKARIEELRAEDVIIKGQLTAAEGDIDNLQTNTLEVTERLTAAEADIEELQSTIITTEILDAKYATIDKLNATNADLNNLESTYAAFEVATTNRFTAAEGNISELETNKLDAATANITYAKIVDLNAMDADITNLEADVADLDTLIFGSATGNTIHSSFANAVVAQLSNAQIKSAMVDSVSASKITSGDIITNNVRVISEDGSLIISDETIQISDGTRVRVQIGKDASNDYSINIWDADGNLMFSEGGITDNAIKTAIIRNDMVSDTANIAAHKLDINSLFEEINGSTKTIKSSKIYLDEENQTLDVAFETMSTDLTELQNGVSTQGTQITAIQGQIASKIWQQDINTAVTDVNTTTSNLSTQYEELMQEVDGLTATASSHTSTLATKADSSTVTEVSDRVTTVETDLSGFKSTVSDTYATKTALSTTDTKASNAQTAAADAQSDIDALAIRVGTAETDISQNATAIGLRATKSELDTAKSEVLSTASADATEKANNALTSANANTTNLLKSYSTTTEMNAAIQLKADGITSSVSSTYATKTALETTNSNVTKASTAASNAQTAADNAQSSADAAQSDIDNLSIGGRNLIAGTSENQEYVGNVNDGSGTYKDVWTGKTIVPPTDTEYVVSFDAKADIDTTITCYFYSPNTTLTSTSSTGQHKDNATDGSSLVNITTEWARYWVRWTQTAADAQKNIIVGRNSTENDVYIRAVKLEVGNRPTDWTPAPEDMATSDDVDSVQSSVTLAEERITTAETLIQQLTDSISTLVVDGNGESLMTQTADGWTFSTAELQDIVDTTSENLDALTNEVGDIDSAVGILENAVSELGVLNEYVKITTYEGEPCIELGENDSDFKLLITNTRIMFMEGTGVPAYINNQSLFINKAVIEEELQQGSFVWKSRSNGNLGLVWKG